MGNKTNNKRKNPYKSMIFAFSATLILIWAGITYTTFSMINEKKDIVARVDVISKSKNKQTNTTFESDPEIYKAKLNIDIYKWLAQIGFSFSLPLLLAVFAALPKGYENGKKTYRIKVCPKRKVGK